MAAFARVRLRRKLLRISGVEADFIEDPYLQVIADAGAPFANTEVRITRGRPNECHRNAARFWLKGKCAAIAIGYYLGPDHVWRQHSWGVTGDGTWPGSGSVPKQSPPGAARRWDPGFGASTAASNGQILPWDQQKDEWDEMRCGKCTACAELQKLPIACFRRPLS